MKQKFVIDRKTWHRGEGSASSKLLRSDGKMCCLGHVAKQCGYVDDDILNKIAPSDVKDRRRFPEFLIRGEYNSSRCLGLMSVNDSALFTEESREESIKKEFAAHDYEVEFIN